MNDKQIADIAHIYCIVGFPTALNWCRIIYNCTVSDIDCDKRYNKQKIANK